MFPTNKQKQTHGRTKSIKDRFLMSYLFKQKKKNFLIFFLIERRARNGRTDRRTKSIKVRSLMLYLSNQKIILKIGESGK